MGYLITLPFGTLFWTLFLAPFLAPFRDPPKMGPFMGGLGGIRVGNTLMVRSPLTTLTASCNQRGPCRCHDGHHHDQTTVRRQVSGICAALRPAHPRWHAPPPVQERRGARGGPEFFSPPHPPTFLHRRWRMPPRMRGSERSADPAHLPTDRGLVVAVTVMAPTWPPLIANCSQGSERGANHQGIAHPDTPQTPHKRAPFGGVSKRGQKRGPKKVSKKVSRMGELLNTPFFVHFFT